MVTKLSTKRGNPQAPRPACRDARRGENARGVGICGRKRCASGAGRRRTTMNKLLSRIDAAISRLGAEFDNSPVTIAIALTNLRAKREMVASGDYQLETVNEEAVAAVGRLICENTKSREPWY